MRLPAAASSFGLLVGLLAAGPCLTAGAFATEPIRVGIIGLDTSHAIAFTKLLNDPAAPPELAGCPVVAAYPQGSPDIESSTKRVPGYTEEMKALGVRIVDSIDELLTQVDAVLLETNDGRPHLEQVRPVLAAGKPVFIDKPVAGSLADAVAIYRAATRAGVPVFSSSSLRFGAGTQAVRAGSIGRVTSCETSSPASLEPTHPDLFWYGIHGVESLFTVLGTGCESVRRTSDDGKIVVHGSWSDGRSGTFREGEGYSGTARGAGGEAAVGDYEGYAPLVVEIVKFFRTGVPPVSPAETLEIYAFMEAADESKRQGGGEVTLASVMQRAAGFEPLFNGQDVISQKGLAGNPRTRAALSAEQRPTAQATADERPGAAIVFLVTADPQNYEAERTIPRFADSLQERRGHACTVIQGEGPLEKLHFPGLEAVERADLLVVFFRRSALTPAQLAVLRGHLAAGKPLVGIRTANHAFSVNGPPAPGHEAWWAFVPEVLGCENRGYGKPDDGVDVVAVPSQVRHPILAGVEPRAWHAQGPLYRVKPLVDPAATVLLTGSGGSFADEPIAWTRMAGPSRIFYTSLGYPTDFDTPQYRRLLENGIEWALGRLP